MKHIITIESVDDDELIETLEYLIDKLHDGCIDRAGTPDMGGSYTFEKATP